MEPSEQHREVPVTPEAPKKRAPIHIILERHDDIKDSLAQLDKVIGDNLQRNKSGKKVVVFYEDADTASSTAEFVQNCVEDGYYPSDSVAIALFLNKHQRLPDLNNPEEIEKIKEIYDKGTSPDKKEILGVLDKHYKDGRRIGVLWEGIPDEKYKQEMQEKNEFESAWQKSYAHVVEGNFDQGLEFFKRHEKTFAREAKNREDRFAERIAAASQNENVVAVVGRIGAVHTRLGDILTEKGHEVTQAYANEEASQYSPRHELLKRLELSPDQEILELDWYRAMISSVIEDTYATIAEAEGKQTGNIPKSSIIEGYARWYLEKLPTMESIRQFEGKVKQQGLEGALANVYQQ